MRALRTLVWEIVQAGRELRRYVSGDAAIRDEIARAYFFRFARRFTGSLRSEGQFKYHVSTRDLVVGRNTFSQGGFDLAAMRRAVAVSGISLEGRSVLDIGANIGTSTVEFVRHYGAGRVMAVEADAANFKLLRLNVIENDVEDRVECLHLALSDSDGMIRMRRSADNWGDHRVASDGDVDVPARRLDSLVEDGVVDLDSLALVWMDVQGHEAQVLAGAGRLLAAQIPIVTEFWPEALGRRLPEMEALIARHFRQVIDLGYPDHAQEPRVLDAADIGGLAQRYRGDAFADLILVP